MLRKYKIFVAHYSDIMPVFYQAHWLTCKSSKKHRFDESEQVLLEFGVNPSHGFIKKLSPGVFVNMKPDGNPMVLYVISRLNYIWNPNQT